MDKIKDIIQFKSPPPRAHSQIIPAVIFIPAGLFFFIFISVYIIPMRYNEGKTGDVIAFLFGLLILIGGLITFIKLTIRFWTTAYFVDLTEDRVIGYNLWKKSKEIRYADIKIIRKHKRFNELELISNDNMIMVLNGGIDNYGQCIEAIRERAVNVQKVDYGGIDKMNEVWNNYYGWDEKMKKIHERYKKK